MSTDDEIIQLKHIVIDLQTRIINFQNNMDNHDTMLVEIVRRLKELEEESVEDAYDEIPALDRMLSLGTGFEQKTNPPVNVSLEDDELRELEDRVLRGYC